MKNLLYYILPFSVYVLATYLTDIFKLNFYLSYSIRGILTFLLFVYFWKKYKVKFKLDFLSIIIGVVIFIVWLALEGVFVKADIQYDPTLIPNLFVPLILLKVFSMVLVAPFIEELFTRSFLIRFFIEPRKWEKVKLGSYTFFSFILTALFFGFMHQRWLQGIIVGIILNLLLYKTKRIDTCIQAHIVGNLLLAVFAIITQNWVLW